METGGNNSSGPGGGVTHRRSRNAHYRQARKRPKGMVKADINVTPLVDVVLVLLIIFMVVTPMLSRGVSVDLPMTSHHNKKADDGKDIIVSVTMAGEIYINTDRVPLEKVAAVIEDEKRRSPDKVVFLKGDNRISYGKAREVMEAIHKANIEDIQLGTEEPKKVGN